MRRRGWRRHRVRIDSYPPTVLPAPSQRPQNPSHSCPSLSSHVSIHAGERKIDAPGTCWNKSAHHPGGVARFSGVRFFVISSGAICTDSILGPCGSHIRICHDPLCGRPRRPSCSCSMMLCSVAKLWRGVNLECACHVSGVVFVRRWVFEPMHFRRLATPWAGAV